MGALWIEPYTSEIVRVRCFCLNRLRRARWCRRRLLRLVRWVGWRIVMWAWCGMLGYVIRMCFRFFPAGGRGAWRITTLRARCPLLLLRRRLSRSSLMACRLLFVFGLTRWCVRRMPWFTYRVGCFGVWLLGVRGLRL